MFLAFQEYAGFLFLSADSKYFYSLILMRIVLPDFLIRYK